MALRKIREYGDEILTKKCREVKEMTPRLKELVEDMLETMYQAEGVGLAAPQVGVLRRIVVIDVGEGPIVLVNPKIVEQDGEQEGNEGCLSVPGKAGVVKRPNHVIAEGLDENMNPVRVEGEELLARLEADGRGGGKIRRARDLCRGRFGEAWPGCRCRDLRGAVDKIEIDERPQQQRRQYAPNCAGLGLAPLPRLGRGSAGPDFRGLEKDTAALDGDGPLGAGVDALPAGDAFMIAHPAHIHFALAQAGTAAVAKARIHPDAGEGEMAEQPIDRPQGA